MRGQLPVRVQWFGTLARLVLRSPKELKDRGLSQIAYGVLLPGSITLQIQEILNRFQALNNNK